MVFNLVVPLFIVIREKKSYSPRNTITIKYIIESYK